MPNIRLMNEIEYHCKTRLSNTHNTAERRVLYDYHPWAGRSVGIDRVVEKSGIAVARCKLSSDAPGLPLELPLWMFDRLACSAVRCLQHPQVDLVALCDLRCLLTEIAGTDGSKAAASSTAPDLSADVLSDDQNQGDDHASISYEVSPVGSVRSTGQRQFRHSTAMAEPAEPYPAQGDQPSGTVAHRTLPGGNKRTRRRGWRPAPERGER